MHSASKEASPNAGKRTPASPFSVRIRFFSTRSAHEPAGLGENPGFLFPRPVQTHVTCPQRAAMPAYRSKKIGRAHV